MRNTYCVSFACRKAKTDKAGKAYISAIIIINGQRTTFNLPRKEKPEDFDKAMASRRSNEIKSYCETVRQRLDKCANEMSMQDYPLTAANLKEWYFNGHSASYRLTRLRDEYLSVVEKRGVRKQAWYKYMFAMDSLIAEIGDKEIKSVTNADIRKWLDTVKAKFEPSTVYGYFTKLKSFFIYAYNDEKIDRNPFGSIRVGRGIKTVDILSEEDYQAILQSEFDIWRIQRIRDIFIFACNSGLAWTDCYHLKPSDFVEKDGHLCIQKPRVKTGIPYNSIILPDGAEIAKKYNFDFASLQISNQRTNQSLKDIQSHCKVKSVESLTFHCARHYYINKLIASGVAPAVVSKCAGHTNFVQSYNYSNLNLNDMINEVGRHISI